MTNWVFVIIYTMESTVIDINDNQLVERKGIKCKSAKHKGKITVKNNNNNNNNNNNKE